MSLSAAAPITVERWPSERPLFVLALLVSVGVWALAVVSIIGLVYAVLFGLFFAAMHVAFIAYVRGNAVRLGPDQFPDLHARVAELARRMGLDPVPEVYLMQAGGALNAFATRFLRRHLVVLFTDLLDACGENTGARDMIIAHELGHIRAGHLRYHWLLLPAHMVPFLGQALSRAREYTCDRYGRAGAGSTDAALVGLAILAAGGRRGPYVNRRALVAQRADLNTGLMTIGEWLSTHPPLAKRMLALEPALEVGAPLPATGQLRALTLVMLLMLAPVVGMVALATAAPDWWAETIREATAAGAAAADSTAARHYKPPVITDTAATARAAWARLDTLGLYLEARRGGGQQLPKSAEALYALYQAERDAEAPLDPFDGLRFGYERDGDHFHLWSSGPDQESGTDDDLEWRPAGHHRPTRGA